MSYIKLATRLAVTTIALMLTLDALAKSILYIGIGSEFTVNKADFDTPPSFSKDSQVTAAYTDPQSGAPAITPLKVITTDSESATLVWGNNIKLYQEKDLKGKRISEALQKDSSLAPDLELTSLTVGTSNYKNTVYLCQPFIWSLGKNETATGNAGDTYVATGRFLGDKKCKPYVEYTDSRGTPKYKSCKVVKDSFEVNTTTGATTFQFIYPQLPKGATATGYFVIKTPSGITALKEGLTSDEQTALYQQERQLVKTNFAPGNRTADQVKTTLWSVSPYESNIIWNSDKDRVLTITWASSNYWNEGAYTIGQEYSNEYSATWVTLAPELKNYGQQHKFSLITDNTGKTVGDAVNYKIAQLLGMPPDVWKKSAKNPKDVIVEIWVKPEDLVRPAPDPEITDHEAEVWFEYETYGVNLIQYDKTFTTSSDDPFVNFKNFKTWLNNQLDDDVNTYPFTGFGYTYYWGDATNHYGLSEFVIPGQSDGVFTGKFIVNRFIKPIDYFSEDDEAYKQ